MLDSAYVSRVIPLGAADAVAATEAWYLQLEFAPGGRHLIAGPKLLLRPRFEPTDFDSQLLRRLRGTLWVGWWLPVRIELELVRYSRFASEIALRPSNFRWSVGAERYGLDAATAVEGIVAAIMRGELPDRSGESATSPPDGTGRTLAPRPFGIVDRPGQPLAFDPLSH